MNDPYCMEKIFKEDNITRQTIDVLKNHLGDHFEKFVCERAVPILMKHGC